MYGLHRTQHLASKADYAIRLMFWCDSNVPRLIVVLRENMSGTYGDTFQACYADRNIYAHCETMNTLIRIGMAPHRNPLEVAGDTPPLSKGSIDWHGRHIDELTKEVFSKNDAKGETNQWIAMSLTG